MMLWQAICQVVASAWDAITGADGLMMLTTVFLFGVLIGALLFLAFSGEGAQKQSKGMANKAWPAIVAQAEEVLCEIQARDAAILTSDEAANELDEETMQVLASWSNRAGVMGDIALALGERTPEEEQA